MNHPLDNPIWTALTTGSKKFSYGDEHIRLIDRDMGFFAGLPSYEPEHLESLWDVLEDGVKVILFTPNPLELDDRWIVHNDRKLLQMVWDNEVENLELSDTVQPLDPSHVSQMMALTDLMRPGPFLEKTILFGNYFGIFSRNKLISMAGARLNPAPFTEVSAVCTLKDYQGRGLSKKVMSAVINSLVAQGSTPFLHVYPDNLSAFKLYSSLGFVSRAMLRVYSLEKK